MAAISQPRELAELKGAHLKNPQRYRGDVPKSQMPIGNAPDYLSGAAKDVWFEVEAVVVPGILTATDRIMMEVLCNLIAEYRCSPDEFAVGKYPHMISCLARFGMSPSDRGKLAIEKPKDRDEFEVL